VATYPPADITVERIGDLLAYDLPPLLQPARGEGGTMKATQLLARCRPEPLARQHHPRALESRSASAATSTSSRSPGSLEPTIFDHAIKNSHDYDRPIREKTAAGKSGEGLFFELALEDLTGPPTSSGPSSGHQRVDGWVSLEVSPKLAYDTQHGRRGEGALSARAARPKPLPSRSRHQEGVPAIEEAIFPGVRSTLTLLFSREHYVAAARPTSAASSGGSPPG